MLLFIAHLLMVLGIIFYIKQEMQFIKVSESGEKTTLIYDLDTFNVINITGPFHVVLEQDSFNRAHVTLDENFHSLIVPEVYDGILYLPGKKRFKSYDASVHIFFNQIEVINVTGGASVMTKGLLQGETLSLTVESGSLADFNTDLNTLESFTRSGSQTIIRGQAADSYFKLNAGSQLDASAFPTKKCNVQAYNASKAKVWATDFLSATAQGGSSVFYAGHPQLGIISTPSAGSVSKVN